MDNFLKEYEQSIKRKHSISFTPKYEEEFKPNVSNTLFIAIAEKVVEKLEWDLVYKDKNIIVANRKKKFLGSETVTETIIARYEFGNVLVKSESGGIWDVGKNSKRVKLFIFAFQEILKTFEKESLKAFETEVKKIQTWDDYLVPETLSMPTETKNLDVKILVIGCLVIALILGFLLSFIFINKVYAIGLMEALIGTIILFVIKHFIRLSNYTNFVNLQWLLVTMLILVYLSSQYFQYKITLNESDFTGFWAFLNFRYSEGLTMQKFNYDWIFLVVEFGVTIIVCILNLSSILTEYLMERVPSDVVNFAYYHSVKGKSEEGIKKELTKKGWSDVKHQTEVFDAIEAYQNTDKLNRIKHTHNLNTSDS